MKWNERLRREREIRGMTQDQAAKKMERSQPVLSAWELGIHFPSPKNREMLAKFYGKSVEELFF